MIPNDVALLDEQVTEFGRHIDDCSWFERRGISVKPIGSRRILTWNKSKLDHWNRLANGLVIGIAGNLMAFPVMHFYHLGDKVAGHVVANETVDLVEKLDGTMVAVSFPAYNAYAPLISTRDDIWTGAVNQGLIKEIANEIVKNIAFKKFDLNNTLCFEWVDGTKTIKYDASEYGLYLISGRNLLNNSEFSEQELDYIAARFGCKRPRVWLNLQGWSEICDASKSLDRDKEGFIIRDAKKGHRQKWIMTGFSRRCKDAPSVLDNAVDKVMEGIARWRPRICDMSRHEIMLDIKTSDQPRWTWRFIMKYLADEPIGLEDIVRKDIITVTGGVERRLVGLLNCKASRIW